MSLMCQGADLRSVTSRLGHPGSHAVVHGQEVVGDEDGIVAVVETAHEFPANGHSLILAQVVGGQRIGEGGRRRRHEWRGKGSGGSFGAQGIARLEAEGRFGDRELRRRVGDGSGDTVGGPNGALVSAGLYYRAPDPPSEVIEVMTMAGESTVRWQGAKYPERGSNGGTGTGRRYHARECDVFGRNKPTRDIRNQGRGRRTGNGTVDRRKSRRRRRRGKFYLGSCIFEQVENPSIPLTLFIFILFYFF